MDAICTDAVREVVLTKGFVALINEADWQKLCTVEFSDGFVWRGRICDKPWCVCRPYNLYAMTRVSSKHCVYLHRAVMDARADQRIDHVSGNGLDNRRVNLRFASLQENNRNSAKPRSPKATSQFKGVTFDPRRNIYYARIRIGDRQKYLGATKTEEEAARIYDAKALELFGQFARLNFPILPSHAEALG